MSLSLHVKLRKAVLKEYYINLTIRNDKFLAIFPCLSRICTKMVEIFLFCVKFDDDLLVFTTETLFNKSIKKTLRFNYARMLTF